MLIEPIRTPLGCYIYDANMNDIIKVNEQLFNYVLSLMHGDKSTDFPEETLAQFEELQTAGYFAPSHVEVIEYPGIELIHTLLDRSLELLTLQVTQSCNLRCKYCIYSENSNFSQRSHAANFMSFDVAKKAIDYYHLHSIDNKRAVIGFYGGEPLLAFPLIKKVVLYAEEIMEGKELSFDITTNATLLSDEIIDFLIEHKFLINISIDGPKEVQDKNRVFPDGSGSFDIVMSKIRKLWEKDPDKLLHSGISMVIDSKQNYQELLSLFDDPCFSNVNLLHSFMEVDGRTVRPSDSYIAEYNNALALALLEKFRSQTNSKQNKFTGHGVQSVFYDASLFESRPLPSVGVPSGPCIPGKIRLFVNCFGDFYPCERVNEKKHMKIGSLDRGFDLDNITNMLRIGCLAPEKCKNCWAFSLCNICAKNLDDGTCLSPRKRDILCEESRSSAKHMLREKVLLFEHRQHMREIAKWTSGGET